MEKAKWAVVIVSILTWGAGSTLAGDGIEFELTADFYSRYIWRGQNLSDDPVFQTGLSAGGGGLTASVWGSLETTNINGNSGDFSEVDYALDYSGDVSGVEGLGYSVGLIYYDFPGTAARDTTELYWGFSFDTLLSPSVTVYHDIDEAEGAYVSVGLGHCVDRLFDLSPGVPVAMELSAAMGWGSAAYNDYYWGLKRSKANDLTLSASFPFDWAGWTVSPSLNYSVLMSSDIRSTDTYNTDSDYFFVGIGFSKSF